MNVPRLPVAFDRKTALSVLAYAAAIAMLVAIGLGACASSWQAWTNYSSAAVNLEHLRAHKDLAGMRLTTQPPAGSAYIQGQTATVAGAALQQRIGAILSQAGGSVASSEVDLHGAGADNGRIALVVACDLDQNALQRALYEIEAGMPVLTVDRLTAQTAPGEEKSVAPRLRAQLAISGQWRATQ